MIGSNPEGNLFETRPPVWIIRQEHFSDDLAVFLDRLGYTGSIDLTSDSTGAHANDYSGIPPLSDMAKENLRRWFAQDYAFLAQCEAWMARSHSPS